MGWGWGWKPYVSVAERKAKATRAMDKLRKKGLCVQPVVAGGRLIARTFWGKAWCEHLEKFSDFENRLPRGRSYLRNGLVCHLEIEKGKIAAKVSGSRMYDVEIKIKNLSAKKWKTIKERCAGQIGSILELLRGKISEYVMNIVTDKNNGLFPLPKEIDLDCSCPDWADMCKHVAAVLYGVGVRLDEKPDLLFLLRGVDHEDLTCEEAAKTVVSKAPAKKGRVMDEKNIETVFGIDLSDDKNSGRNARSSSALTDMKAKRTPSKRKSAGTSPESEPAGKRKKRRRRIAKGSTAS